MSTLDARTAARRAVSDMGSITNDRALAPHDSAPVVEAPEERPLTALRAAAYMIAILFGVPVGLIVGLIVAAMLGFGVSLC